MSEAILENKYKKIWIESAWIGKNKSGDFTQAPETSGSYLASRSSADNIIFNSNEKSNTSDENSPAKFQHRIAELDREYMSAVESGNMETAQRLVDEAAKENGYNSPVLYHGTSAFGFTAFELSKMDDQRSIFLTDSNEVASTYSGVDGTRQIQERNNVDIDKLSGRELAEYLNEYPPDNTVDYSYSFMQASDIEKLKETVNKDIEYAKKITAEEITKFDNSSGEYHQLKTLQSALVSKQLGGLSTIIYSALHYGESFRNNAKQSAKLNELEQNVRLLQKVKNIPTLSSIVDTYDNGFIVEKALGGYSIEVLDLNVAKNNLNISINKGNYQLYAKSGNSLVVETNGANWNTLDYKIPDNRYEIRVNDNGDYEVFDKSSNNIKWIDGKRAFSSYDEVQNAINTLEDKNTWNKRLTTTREIAEYAQKNGHDSVVFQNIRDNGGNNLKVKRDTTSNVYVVFNPNDVKSADTVTYDDNGNVIPLSERFNENKIDLRFQAKKNTVINTDYSDLSKLDEASLRVYNARGWAKGLFTGEDLVLLNQRISEIFHKNSRYARTTLSDGTTVLDLNNKLVLLSGDLESPVVNFVLAINAKNETNAMFVREDIKYELHRTGFNKETFTAFLRTSQLIYGEESVRLFDRDDYRYIKGRVDTGYRASLPDNWQNYGYTKSKQNRGRVSSETQSGVSEAVSKVTKFQYKSLDALSDTELLARHLEENSAAVGEILRRTADIEMNPRVLNQLVNKKLKEYGISKEGREQVASVVPLLLDAAKLANVKGRDITADLTSAITEALNNTDYSVNLHAEERAEVCLKALKH